MTRKARSGAAVDAAAHEQQQPTVPASGTAIVDVLLRAIESAGWEWFVVQDREGITVNLSRDVDETTVLFVTGKADTFFNALGNAAAAGATQLDALRQLGIRLGSAFENGDTAASEVQ